MIPPSTSPADHPVQRRRRHRLWSGVLVLALFVCGLFADGLHEVLEPHRYCAVHQAVEHGEGEAVGNLLDEAGHDLSDVSLEAPASGDEGHESCTLPSFTVEEKLALEGPSGKAFAPTSVRAARHACTASQHTTIDVYRLAPKTSPPAATRV